MSVGCQHANSFLLCSNMPIKDIKMYSIVTFGSAFVTLHVSVHLPILIRWLSEANRIALQIILNLEMMVFSV